jgi:hypothetical protein
MILMENEFSVQDLISLSYDQKPIEFNQAFDSVISAKLADAVNARKIEVAQSMFGTEQEEQEEEETVVDDNETTDQEEDTDGEAA